MTGTNPDIYIRYLLSGGTPTAARGLLQQITIEEMIYVLASLPSEAFIPYNSDEEDCSSDYEALDASFLGNLIIRSLDSLLDKETYKRIFNDEKIMKVISDGIDNANYYIRRLISKHFRRFIENGGSNEKVYEVTWKLLFDKEYSIFDDSMNSICTISTRAGEKMFLNKDRMTTILGYLSGYLVSNRLDQVTMSVRILEFCTMLGRESLECLELLKENDVYEKVFELYMENDVLVRLNCIEILDSMSPIMKHLRFDSRGAKEFLRHAIEMFKGKFEDPDSEILMGPLLRFFSTIIFIEDVLGHDESVGFSKCVADIIMNNGGGKVALFQSSLASFGPLYIRGYLDERVCEKFLDIIRNCKGEDILYSCLESLEFVVSTKDLSKSKFISEASSSIISVIHRFPFSEVKEACLTFLTNSLDFDHVAQVLVKSEKESKLLTSEEDTYETILTKRTLIKKFLSRLDELYGQGTYPLSDSVIQSLRSF